MKETLIKLFKPNPKSLSLNEIKDSLGFKQITDNENKEIVNKLLKMELDGKIYYDFTNNRYYVFPSNFFVSKIKNNLDGVIYFGIDGNLASVKTRNKDAKTKDYVIVKKLDNNNYKLIKVISKPHNLEKDIDTEKIYNLFNPSNATFTLKQLMKVTKAEKQELIPLLEELENEGILYYDDEKNVYKSMPNNYFVTTVEVNKKGISWVNLNGTDHYLAYEDASNILPFDKVLVKKDKKKISLVKIIKRTNPEIVCEVEENGIKIVGNKNILVKCSSDEFKKMNLPVGTRFLASITNQEFNNYYEVNFINVLGNKFDLNAELEAITYNNGFKVRYTDEELEELESIPTEVDEKDKENRVDLTKENIFTIDGAHTKDMDDAVCVKKLKNGNYELMVSIAAVSHYIKYGGALFNRAAYNTTSVYLIDSVNHMLHPQVSNGICSLNPGVERLAKTYKIEIDPNGNIVDFTFFDSVIKSKKKMTYEDCNLIFQNNRVPDGYEPFVDDLLLMQELAQIIENRRKRNGALDFGNSEIEFILNENGDIEDVVKQTTGTAEKLIENFMVITNESVAEHMYNLGIEFVYRNHEIPFDNKVKETITLIKTMGYKINILSNSTDPHVIQAVINSLKSKEEFFILSSLLLKSMQKAYFSTTNKGHYGLALNAYSQTTSPIRRLMDLMIEYILDNLDKIYDGTIKMDDMKTTLNRLCERASLMERCAEKAEYEANKLYMIDYVINRKDHEYEAYVQEITPSYMVVKTKELIEGIVYFTDIEDGTYTYNPNCKWLESKSSKHRIMIGSKALVRFKDANREFRILRFSACVNNLELTRKRKD